MIALLGGSWVSGPRCFYLGTMHFGATYQIDIYIHIYIYIYIYISIFIYGNRISEGSRPRPPVVGGPGGHYFDFNGHLIDIIEILVFSSLSNLSDLMKMVILHKFEPPGHRKSDSFMKNDSF